jgi:hypothetical protein
LDVAILHCIPDGNARIRDLGLECVATLHQRTYELVRRHAAPRSFLGFITAKWHAYYRLQANQLR